MLTNEQRALVEDNINLIYSYIHRHGLPLDDWFDILAFTLCRNISKFDPDRGTLSTYAYKLFDNEIRLYYRNQKLKKNGIDYVICSLDDAACVDSDSGNETKLMDLVSDSTDVSDYVINHELLNQVCDYINRLDDRDRNIFLMSLNDYTQNEIANRFDISQCQVSRLIKRIRTEIIRKFGGCYYGK